MKRSNSSIFSDSSAESSNKRIFSEEKIISLNRSFSLLESQPSVHFSLISQFLPHSSTIKLFRSSHRLYSIPLLIPIFLNYFNENQSYESSFKFQIFFSKNRKNLRSQGSISAPALVSNFYQNFRFLISSMKMNTKKEFTEWKKFLALNQNWRIFSRLTELEFDFEFSNRNSVNQLTLLRRFIPSSVKILKINRLLNPGNCSEIFSLPQLETLQLIDFDGILPNSFGSDSNSLNCLTLIPRNYESEFVFTRSHFPISLTKLNLLHIKSTSNSEFPSLNYLINLKELLLPQNFNQSIEENYFPSSLEFIEFGEEFNQPIYPGILPSSLKELIFINNSQFNQPFQSGSIPGEIEILQFGHCFNQPLSEGIFSFSLRVLIFGHNFDQPINPGVLPNSVKIIHFYADSHFNQPIQPGWMPEGIEKLRFGLEFNQPLSSNIFPSSLKILHFGSHFNQPLSKEIFPSSLRELKLGGNLNQPLTLNIFPSSLEILDFGHLFNQPINHEIFPSSLKYLEFGDSFNQPLSERIFPPSLEKLKFGRNFDQPIKISLLSKLKSLTIHSNFHPLFPSILPSSLEELKFQEFFYPIPPKFLPTKLNGKFEFSCYGSNPKLKVGDSVKFKKFQRISRMDKKYLQIEEKLGISKNSKFRVIERMEWNENIYLIEIIEDQFQNEELKNISWTRLLVDGKNLRLFTAAE